MKRYEKIIEAIQSILVLSLIILVVLLINFINDIQGNARIVNYAGMARGQTQRLIKLEITNNVSDNIVVYLDNLLYSLKNGGGEHSLKKLPDKAFRDNLAKQEDMWNQLKQEINETRKAKEPTENIIPLSEEYYNLADETTRLAARYTDALSHKIGTLQNILTYNVVLIIISIIHKSIAYILISKKNKDLIKVAYIDLNTGLNNKSRCDSLIEEQGILNPDELHVAIMFDLNNLKTTNDTLGHQAGDLLIYNFARIIKKHAPKDAFIGRYGGDEFICILINTDKKVVETYINEVDSAVNDFTDSTYNIRISYAVGYESSEGIKDCSLNYLIKKADEKMYIDKIEKKKLNKVI